MKHIKLFEEFSATFEAQNKLTPKQEVFLNTVTNEGRGTWSLNPQTGLVDVDGSVRCYNMGLRDLKGVRFGNVSGNFLCEDNKLTSLAGAPQTVGGSFWCNDNKLTSLVGAPQTVGEDFYCGGNPQLTSLVGAPKTVGGIFDCAGNQLTSLAGSPQTIKGLFSCSRNQLTSLVGAPKTVAPSSGRTPPLGGDFRCADNQLTSLVGSPLTVSGDFYCGRNNQLTSLVGAPKTVGGIFDCKDNPQLTSLEGAPKAGIGIVSDIKTTAGSASVSIASEFEDYETGETYDIQGEWEDFDFSVKGDTVIFSGRAYIGDVKGSYSDKRGLEMTMMVDIFTFADWFKDNPVKIMYRVNKIKPEDVIGDIHNTLVAIQDTGTDWESVKDVSKFLRDYGLKTTSKILEPED